MIGIIEHSMLITFQIVLFGSVFGVLLIRNQGLSYFFIAIISVVSYAIAWLFSLDLLSWFLGVLIPVCLVGYGIYLVKHSSVVSDLNNNVRVTLLATGRRVKHITNINRGVGIFGASGAGKSESVIYQILKWCAQTKRPGIINDYKNYELTEIAYPLFLETGIPFHVFALHDVSRSVRINPINPAYIQTESEVNGLVKVLMLNLSGEVSDDTAMFFRGGAESLMAGVIWRLREAYPQYCTLPHVLSILLNYENLHLPRKPFGKLVNFLQEDIRAAMLASTFLTGLGSEKQTASLFATLAESLRTLVSPEVFYLLSGNDIDLEINKKDNQRLISFVNHPGAQESIISAINATIIATCMTRMAERNRPDSFVLLDEAPTIKINELAKRIATLRSYCVAFIYCVQDKIQGVAQWGGKEYHIKQILTNLSTQFFGKVNDPETAGYYEKFFEIIKKEQRSYSSRDGLLVSGDRRTTRSKKEEAKIRAFEFFKFVEGEFVMFTNGKDDHFRFHYEAPEKLMPPPVRLVTPTELQRHYYQILNETKDLFANY